jgi:hypothetical protein
LNAVLLAFKELARDRFVSNLCNFDIRQGIEIAQAVLKFPFYPWPDLAHVVYEQYQGVARSSGASLIKFERILDAIVRRCNLLCEPSVPFFDNIFMVDESDHFANSLTKMFILKLCAKRTHSVEEIRGILGGLGHPLTLVDRALQRLLSCNIITSPQGVSLVEHKIREVGSSGTTLCKTYLEVVSCALFYVQGMAYYTPLDASRCSLIPLPSEANEDGRTFAQRVEAAGVLISQVQEDVDGQMRFLADVDGSGADAIRRGFIHYEFSKVLPGVRAGIRKDLKAIQNSGAFANVDWNAILQLFAEPVGK